MERIKKIGVWYVMLNKRLFKKKSFLLILCMVPCLTLGMRLVSEQDSSVLRIGLYANEDDEAGNLVIQGLMEKDSIIHYERAASIEEAEAMVRQAKVDGAWIFENSLSESLQGEDGGTDGKSVRVLQREDNMQMRLARVKLYEEVYPHYVYGFYLDYLQNHFAGKDGTEDMLRQYFENGLTEESLFEMRYADVSEPVGEASYLTAPLRGMMALWLVLVGLASAMYYLQDEKNGLFAWIPVKRRYFLIWGYHLIPILDGAVVVLAALGLSGTYADWGRELLSMLLFTLMISGFCTCCQILCGKMERLGSVIPVLLLGMLALCPVFLNVRQLHEIQLLLPPYYYLNSLHSSRTVMEMALYAAAVYGLGWLFYRLKPNRA